MSPEQTLGAVDIDGRTDIYALGCVMYEMLSGVLPFKGKTTRDMLVQHASHPVPDIRKSNSTIPGFAARAVERAMAKDPGERFQTADHLAIVLKRRHVAHRRSGWGEWWYTLRPRTKRQQ
jgi:serine/threonine-protein kinase